MTSSLSIPNLRRDTFMTIAYHLRLPVVPKHLPGYYELEKLIKENTTYLLGVDIGKQDGFVEQDSKFYYVAFLENLKKIKREILESVKAICICGQT